MKKLNAVLACLVASSAVYALPVYNPAQPELLKYDVFTCRDDCWGVELGYRGDFVFDRKLKLQNTSNLAQIDDDGFGTHRNNNFELYTNAAQLTVDLWDRLDVYGWVGGSLARFDATIDFVRPDGSSNFGPFDGPFNLVGRTQEEISYGFGARAILWKCGRTAVGVDAQYAHYQGEFTNITIDGIPVESVFVNQAGIPIRPNQFKLKHQEYQVALGISHRICMLVPYVAVKYSAVKDHIAGPFLTNNTLFDEIDPRISLRSRHHFGVAVGVSLVDAERMHVTAEGRWIDERALTIAADFRF